VESTVDQTGRLADGEEAAYALDPTQRADVAPRALRATQRRTGQIHPVVALRIIADPGRGGMNPQVLSSPDLSNRQLERIAADLNSLSLVPNDPHADKESNHHVLEHAIATSWPSRHRSRRS
jgi:hypothetical protein